MAAAVHYTSIVQTVTAQPQPEGVTSLFIQNFYFELPPICATGGAKTKGMLQMLRVLQVLHTMLFINEIL
ncbi:hypothetical protein L3Y34_012648 [Caenorhabditis briggsae]|uniref:Uncharacterized protein n=1 Tax=Caenorhabditis briggsae TaxID=6238 RepID=A0AAE8ZUZ3_CAEBR|nr:hypothetical protein L3Y34_012648 [Caenorhabditis briggsae]